MKAFLSYSHRDKQYLDVLLKFLAMVITQGLIDAWSDLKISPGDSIDPEIEKELSAANIYIPLISADFLASKYCQRELRKARYLHNKKRLIIIPIILEFCDWQNGPLKNIKALPTDGRPISDWPSQSKAWLLVTQELRKLLEAEAKKQSASQNSTPQKKAPQKTTTPKTTPPNNPTARNLSDSYKTKKNFDAIHKIPYIKEIFAEIKIHLLGHMRELNKLNNIETLLVADESQEMNCLLVNRNIFNAEASSLILIIRLSQRSAKGIHPLDEPIVYSIAISNHIIEKGFRLCHDDYNLFFTNGSAPDAAGSQKRLTPTEMAEIILNDWTASVGIVKHF